MQNPNRPRSNALLRIWHIVGDPKALPPIPARVPVGRSTWWQWVRDGKAPAPIKLGPRTTAWYESEVDDLIDSLGDVESEASK